MAGPAAAAAPVYVAGAALFYGAMYAVSPEFRQAHNNLGEAMYEGGARAVDQIGDLIFSEEEAPATPTTNTQATTETATGEQACPAIPYWHYTDQAAQMHILSIRAFTGTPFNYFANATWGPRTVFYALFIGNPAYRLKPYFWINVMLDCTVPLAPDPGLNFGYVAGFRHAGRLNERPPHVVITGGGPNVFPEHPAFDGTPLP